jgi:hypothetical protein
MGGERAIDDDGEASRREAERLTPPTSRKKISNDLTVYEKP